MSTNPANEQLSAYLDGELEDAEAASVEAALSGDAELRAELDRLKGVQRLLRTHGRARAPEGFAERVIAAAAAEENVVAFPWWRRPFGIPVEGVLIAAAAALVLIVALPRNLGTATVAPSEDAAPAAAVSKDAPSTEGLGTESLAKDDPTTDGLADAGEADGGEGDGDEGGPAPTKEASPKEMAKDGGAKKAPVDSKVALGTAEGDPGELGGTEAGGLAGGGSTDNAAVQGTAEGTTAPTRVDDPKLVAAGLSGELYTDDEAVLGKIQAIVARYDGRVLDGKGNVITLGVLDAGESIVFLDVPQEHMTAVNKGLSQLGVSVQVTSNKLAADDRFQLPVRIVITANAPSTYGEGAPNAARQKQMDYDEAEMVDQ